MRLFNMDHFMVVSISGTYYTLYTLQYVHTEVTQLNNSAERPCTCTIQLF